MCSSLKSAVAQKMWPRFGIKIGNSTLCVAYCKEDGKVEVIANKQGDRVSQACIMWDANAIECGLTAKQKMATRPKQGISNSLRMLMGGEQLYGEKEDTSINQLSCCEYDIDNEMFRLRCAAVDEDDAVKENVRYLSAYDVQVELLRAELELARQYHTGSFEQKPIAVVSIPNYYPKSAWLKLANAAEEAGFRVAQTVAEPTAAVLANGIAESSPRTTSTYVVTIKSGGLFSHFALYAVFNGLYMLLESYGPFPVGGQNYTEALVRFICDEFKRKYKLDPHESRRSMAKIYTAAANCKHILTTLPSTQLYIDSLMDGIDFNTQMSRARFESLIQPVISGFMQTLSECVERAMKSHGQIKVIDHIVLLGATMAIPKLQSVIAARFPDAGLNTSISTDEVVAVGCAKQAQYLVEPFDQQELNPTDTCFCTNESLLIWHDNNQVNAQLLLDKDTLLPATVRLYVVQSETAEDHELFQISVGSDINEVQLKGATTTKDGVFHVEALVDWIEENNGETVRVRLRCV